MNSLQERFHKEINELVEACHRCAQLNYVTSAGGNLSVRVAEDMLLITPTKTLKRTMRFDDICIINLNGDVLYASEGKKPTGEWRFHTRIMHKRPDVLAIVHAHPPILTGFAIVNNDLLNKAFLPEPIIEIGPLLTVPYETPLSEKLSERFDAVIDHSNGFLMENHGALFCSSVGITDAVELLNMAECMAKSVLVAEIFGNAKPLSSSCIEDMDKVTKIRNLKMPGKPGKFSSASDLYQI